MKMHSTGRLKSRNNKVITENIWVLSYRFKRGVYTVENRGAKVTIFVLETKSLSSSDELLLRLSLLSLETV